jgi:hypothetical protein
VGEDSYSFTVRYPTRNRACLVFRAMLASAIQPKPKRNPIAAWFAKRWTIKKDRVDVSEPSQEDNKEVDHSLDRLEQNDERVRRVARKSRAPKEARVSDARCREHDDQHSTAQGSAKARNGDTNIVSESSPNSHEEVNRSLDRDEQNGERVRKSAKTSRAHKETRDSDSGRRGRDYQHITAQGNARMHAGDTYIEQQVVGATLDLGSKMSPRGEFMKNLGFDLMGARLATIGRPYAQTCEWLFNKEEYERWQDPGFYSTHNGFLWIKGKPGAGKSTMMKHALQYMQVHNYDRSTILSFFFNARGHALEKTTEGMYRSLLYQMFNIFPRRLPEQLLDPTASWRTQGWPLQTLQDLLRDAFLGFGNKRKLVCYIDALDECSEDAIRLAVEYFEELQTQAESSAIPFYICFASRHYPNITMERCEIINLDTEGEHHQDISIFVTQKLRGMDGLRTYLSNEISRRSLGVFLWAALVVQIMNKMMDQGATRSELLAGLKKVPDGIEKLLRNIMLDSDASLLPTLQWVLFSRRPLRIDELYFAIKTSIGHLDAAIQDAAETSEEQMRKFIMTSSRGLVEPTSIFDTKARAQFIHETVREHLLNGGLAALDSDLTGNVEAISHAGLGKWCQNYIQDCIETRSRFETPFTDYSAHHMLAHLENAYSGRAVDLLSIDDVPQRIWDALKIFVDSRDEAKTPTPLYVLIRFGCIELAAAILRRQMALSASNSDRGQTALLRKSSSSGIPPVNVNALCGDGRNNTALIAALDLGASVADKRFIKLLLDCDADPNLAVTPGYTPLLVALFQEKDHPNSHIPKMLLRHGADPNTPISPQFLAKIGARKDFYELHCALAVAVGWKHESMVKSLLKAGADVSDERVAEALCLAAGHTTPSIVRMLIKAGAVFSDRNGSNSTTLQRNIVREPSSEYSSSE